MTVLSVVEVAPGNEEWGESPEPYRTITLLGLCPNCYTFPVIKMNDSWCDCDLEDEDYLYERRRR